MLPVRWALFLEHGAGERYSRLTTWLRTGMAIICRTAAIRVYDENLNLLAETGLPTGKKATLTYANGLLLTGSGNQWGATYDQNDPSWKKITAYSIATGNVAWTADLSAYTYTTILNAPYYNGYFYAETQEDPDLPSLMFKINAATGKVEQVLDYGQGQSSCATDIIAAGKIFSGDDNHDDIMVTQIATGSNLDWTGPFGDPQTNQMALPDEPGATNVSHARIIARAKHVCAVGCRVRRPAWLCLLEAEVSLNVGRYANEHETDASGFKLALAAVFCLPLAAAVAQVNPESASGLDYYSQGGVVVNGVAYFTANDQEANPDFPSVVAFDLRSFRS